MRIFSSSNLFWSLEVCQFCLKRQNCNRGIFQKVPFNPRNSWIKNPRKGKSKTAHRTQNLTLTFHFYWISLYSILECKVPKNLEKFFLKLWSKKSPYPVFGMSKKSLCPVCYPSIKSLCPVTYFWKKGQCPVVRCFKKSMYPVAVCPDRIPNKFCPLPMLLPGDL